MRLEVFKSLSVGKTTPPSTKTLAKVFDPVPTQRVTIATEGTSSSPVNRTKQSQKHLTKAEYHKRKEKRLCFRCEEKYSIGHKCKNPQLRVYVVKNDESIKMKKRRT